METQAKNIAAWTPVVAETVHGMGRLDEKAVSTWASHFVSLADQSALQFSRYLPAIYPLIVELLARDITPEVRLAIHQFFKRVGVSQGLVDPDAQQQQRV